MAVWQKTRVRKSNKTYWEWVEEENQGEEDVRSNPDSIADERDDVSLDPDLDKRYFIWKLCHGQFSKLLGTLEKDLLQDYGLGATIRQLSLIYEKSPTRIHQILEATFEKIRRAYKRHGNKDC